MNIQTAKMHLNKALNKTNFFYETCISFLNQTAPPKTFITYLKKFSLNINLVTQTNFEKIIELSNKKVLMFSKEQNNYYIFVFYE